METCVLCGRYLAHHERMRARLEDDGACTVCAPLMARWTGLGWTLDKMRREAVARILKGPWYGAGTAGADIPWGKR